MKKYSGRPFALIGVHIGGLNAKQLFEVMTKENLPWRSFADDGNAGAGPIAKKWNLSATPTFYLIDHQGIIRRKWAGPPGETALDAVVEKLVENTNSKPD